jgi:hypothetical protein
MRHVNRIALYSLLAVALVVYLYRVAMRVAGVQNISYLGMCTGYIPCNIILFENVKRFGENPSKIENSESDTLKMRSCFMVPGMKMRHARTERNNLRTGTPTNNATNTVGSYWKPDPRWSSPAHGSHAHLQRGRVPIGFLDRLGGPSASAHSSHARTPTLVWIRRTQEMT